MKRCIAYCDKPNQRIIATIKGFAHVVRTRYYGQERTVKAGAVQLVISSIGTTLVLEGHAIQIPLKEKDSKNLIFPLHYLMQSHRNRDLATKKELAVPVEIVMQAQQLLKPNSAKSRLVAQLILITIFYLLRVGEHAKPRRQTRTVQFSLGYVLFWKH